MGRGARRAGVTRSKREHTITECRGFECSDERFGARLRVLTFCIAWLCRDKLSRLRELQMSRFNVYFLGERETILALMGMISNALPAGSALVRKRNY
ncbi:hypothetical protein E2C01_080080 [Portunus trituberculatus]|uniref:Uncharacterized protein n=1 Tax=Portunus trituberculatus TaxID=210409 RepID=A0A5B7IIK5_PORTR|nr:hypothetical protein [Portunus trituberculatus]